MLDFRKNKFIVHLFKSDCLKPGISVPLGSASRDLVCKKVKPAEGDLVFKLSGVLFSKVALTWEIWELRKKKKKNHLNLTAMPLPVTSPTFP